MDTEPKTNTEKTLAIWKIFQSEKGWEVDRIGKQAAFINWLQGLASAMTVDFTYYDQMRLMSAWFDVDEDTALEMAERGERQRHKREVYKMTIHKAKASAYNEVTTAAVYDYMRQYLAEISRMIEPEEDGTGNAYKAKLQQMEGVNRQTLKTCAAELETIVKRLKYAIDGQY